jgi:hypothetical protein
MPIWNGMCPSIAEISQTLKILVVVLVAALVGVGVYLYVDSRTASQAKADSCVHDLWSPINTAADARRFQAAKARGC